MSSQDRHQKNISIEDKVKYTLSAKKTLTDIIGKSFWAIAIAIAALVVLLVCNIGEDTFQKMNNVLAIVAFVVEIVKDSTEPAAKKSILSTGEPLYSI